MRIDPLWERMTAKPEVIRKRRRFGILPSGRQNMTESLAATPSTVGLPNSLWQTGRTMLTEAWERLRGFKNWTAADATIQTSRIEDAGFGDVLSICTIVWQDQDRVLHTGEFEVVEGSPLYQLCEHDTVEIRFDPTKPDEFYLPSLLQSRVARVVRLTLFSVMTILVVVGMAVSWFGPHILNAISH